MKTIRQIADELGVSKTAVHKKIATLVYDLVYKKRKPVYD